MIPRPVRIALFLLACAVVVWLSLSPTENLPGAGIWDKAKHAGAYFALVLIGAAAFPLRLKWLVGALFMFGIGIEVLQALLPTGRQGDPADALANSIGIAAGVLLAFAIREAIKVKSRAAGE